MLKRNRVDCRLLKQEPIIIELVGICTLNENIDPLKITFRKDIFYMEGNTGFEGYLQDVVTVIKDIPPVSLSENNIDFGRVIPGDNYSKLCKATNCLTMVTCLTNHMNQEIEVVWQKGAIHSQNQQKIIY